MNKKPRCSLQAWFDVDSQHVTGTLSSRLSFAFLCTGFMLGLEVRWMVARGPPAASDLPSNHSATPLESECLCLDGSNESLRNESCCGFGSSVNSSISEGRGRQSRDWPGLSHGGPWNQGQVQFDMG